MTYYQDEFVTLYHGDCLDILPSLSGVDLIVTSPPYNLGSIGESYGHYKEGQSHGSKDKWKAGHHDGSGIGYDAHEDAMPAAEYAEWQRDVLAACWDALSDTGAIFYNHKPRPLGPNLWTPLELNPGLPLRQIIIWARAGGMNYSPTYYVPTHEWIMVLAKPEWRLKSTGASGLGDVWRINQQPNSDHPAPFPIGIPARAIETTAPRLVLDPFAGSGTTLRAAADAGVKAIGIEKSERYCELIARRLSQGAFDFGSAS